MKPLRDVGFIKCRAARDLRPLSITGGAWALARVAVGAATLALSLTKGTRERRNAVAIGRTQVNHLVARASAIRVIGACPTSIGM